jgi:magnesium transporter
VTSARVYRNGVLERGDLPIDRVVAASDDPAVLVWVDVRSDEVEVLHELAPGLHLDPLAVEDASNRRQRPKVDHYAAHLFVTVHAAVLDDEGLQIREIDAFVTPRVLVTVRDPDVDPGPWVRSWEGLPALLKEGVGALLHGVLDTVVDSHITAVLGLDQRIDDLEDDLFEGRPVFAPARQRQLHALRRGLVRERLSLLPLREVLLDLSRGNGDSDHVVTAALQPYYRDVYDHVIHAVDAAEGLRDLLSAVFETSLSLQDHQLNTVMKKLSAWAAIIGVPTAVTGWYGQNLPYPGFGRHWGFVMSAVLTFGLMIALYIGFKRRDWL